MTSFSGSGVLRLRQRATRPFLLHRIATMASPAAAIMSTAGTNLPSPPEEPDDSAVADTPLVPDVLEVADTAPVFEVAVVAGDEAPSPELAAETSAPPSTV